MTTKHVLVLPSWLSSKWCEGGSFFIEQTEIMSRLAGWKINILIPQARSYWQAKRRNYPQVHGVEIENLDNVEIWRGYFIYYMWRKTRWAWRAFGEQLFLQYVEKHGMPDLLWVHAIPNAGYLAQHLHKKYGIPYFIHEHVGMYSREPFPYFAKKRIKKVIDNSFYCAAVGEPLRLAMLKQIDVAENKISVVYNPVGLEFISPVINRDSKTPLIFISTCYLRAGKNVDSVLRALAVLRSEKHDVELILIGDGEERQKLEALTAELNLQKEVQFLGLQNREQIREHLQNADAFVSASDYENNSVSVLESLSSGLPVATTRVGVAEYIINDENGVLADSTAPDDIAKAMRIILNGNYNRANIHKNAMVLCHPQVFADRVEKMLNL